ncbi:hypothetical protein N431DRAFT_3345 [Stipitochalara longipes BDJ]|nr:hypothetical protein N431DRAFT_3345 [Stipitochalara longipes BDJ]
MRSQAKYSKDKSTRSVLPFEFQPKPSKCLGIRERVPSLIPKQSLGRLCSIAPSSIRQLTAFPTIALSSAISHLYWIMSVCLMPCRPANHDTIMQPCSRDFQIGLHSVISVLRCPPFPRLANQSTSKLAEGERSRATTASSGLALAWRSLVKAWWEGSTRDRNVRCDGMVPNGTEGSPYSSDDGSWGRYISSHEPPRMEMQGAISGDSAGMQAAR